MAGASGQRPEWITNLQSLPSCCGAQANRAAALSEDERVRLTERLEAYREVPEHGEFHVLLQRTATPSGGAGDLFSPSGDTRA